MVYIYIYIYSMEYIFKKERLTFIHWTNVSFAEHNEAWLGRHIRCCSDGCNIKYTCIYGKVGESSRCGVLIIRRRRRKGWYGGKGLTSISISINIYIHILRRDIQRSKKWWTGDLLCATWRGKSSSVSICVPNHIALNAAVTVPNVSRTWKGKKCDRFMWKCVVIYRYIYTSGGMCMYVYLSYMLRIDLPPHCPAKRQPTLFAWLQRKRIVQTRASA